MALLSRLRAYRRRPTVRDLRQQVASPSDVIKARDPQANAECRVPDGDALSLSSVTLVEAFTPSTIHHLQEALPSLARDSDKAAEFVQRLRASSTGYGSLELGPVSSERRWGSIEDRTLPADIAAAWLRVELLTPSLTFLVATFSLRETAGDLASSTRVVRASRTTDVQVTVRGRFGPLRGQIPWSRPRDFVVSHMLEDVRRQHAQEINERMGSVAASCARWLRDRAEGSFAAQGADRVPRIRLVLTGKAEPFGATPPGWLGLVGLHSGVYWKPPDPSPWRLVTDRRVLTVASRRGRVLATGAADATGEDTTNWVIAQRWQDEMSLFCALWASGQLVDEYEDRVGKLRDSVAESRPDRPVREARRVNKLLVSTSFDGTVVAADLRHLSKDPFLYSQTLRFDEVTPFDAQRAKAGIVVPPFNDNLRATHRDLCARLVDDLAEVRAVIVASVQLMGVESTIRLQRVAIFLSVVAVVVATVALVVSA